MSSNPLPSALRVANFLLRPQESQLMHGGDLGDSAQVIDLLKDRWMASLSFAALANVSLIQKQRSAALEAYFAALRGMVNTVPIHHQQRPVPNGSMRGAPVLASSVVQGADTLVITTTAGATLLPGDMLGVAGRLYQVRSACAAVGLSITVPLANRVRAAASAGVAVVWDRPSIEMRRASGGIVSYAPGMVEISGVELIEAIAA